jgi:hypothetical protein
MVSELRSLEFEPGPRINYVARNSHLHKSIRWGSRSIDQCTPHVRMEQRGSGWHAIGGMLNLIKRPPRPFYITWVLWLEWQKRCPLAGASNAIVQHSG